MSTTIKNSDNPRFTKDDNGQWWYKTLGPKDCPRIKAFVRECERCETMFLGHARTRHASTRSTGLFCGVQCANASVKAELRGTRRGPSHKSWQGGRRINQEGYVQVWSDSHPYKNKNNYVYEHRLVMEGILGRHLQKSEHVHHKNGNRADNRPENLELWSKAHPPGQRVTDLLEFARWILATYGPVEAAIS